MFHTLLRVLEEAGHDDHEDDLKSSDKATLNTVKIFVCCLILISGSFVFFPFMKSVRDRKDGCCKGKFFSMLTCFAAGMLLTISIVHIMPEATAMYAEYLEEHEKEEAGEAAHRLLAEEEHDDHGDEEEEHKVGFPLPYVIFLLGFMIMLILDQVIFKSAIKKVENPSPKREVEMEQKVTIEPAVFYSNGMDGSQNPNAIQVEPEKDISTKDTEGSDEYKQRLDPRSLLTFGIALILHSIVDGLAIGVFDQLADITVLAVSVIIHKIPVACTLGTTFLSNGATWEQCQTKVIFILFILASPFGMILGMIAAEADGLVLSIIQALSGGIFIYLACCDLIIHQFHQAKFESKCDNMLKIVAMLVGAAIVLVIIAIAPAHAH